MTTPQQELDDAVCTTTAEAIAADEASYVAYANAADACRAAIAAEAFYRDRLSAAYRAAAAAVRGRLPRRLRPPTPTPPSENPSQRSESPPVALTD